MEKTTMSQDVSHLENGDFPLAIWGEPQCHPPIKGKEYGNSPLIRPYCLCWGGGIGGAL